MRLLPADKNGILRGIVLEEAIKKDKEKGLIPCYVVANLGTTPTCAFDNLEEFGRICQKEGLWLHVDAAYAGTAFACPEYRYLNKGVEYADSFNFNPHKWMLVNFDCSAMWVKNAKYLVEAFNVERIYLEDKHKGLTPEYRHWQIALGRRFRALKLWFVLRMYGTEGIQKHVRHQISLAKYFADLVSADSRFEVCSSSMGLVCFRLKGLDLLTEKLLKITSEKKTIFCIAGNHNHRFCIRFAICSRLTEREDVEFAWKEFKSAAHKVFEPENKMLQMGDEIPEKKLHDMHISTPRCEILLEKTK